MRGLLRKAIVRGRFLRNAGAAAIAGWALLQPTAGHTANGAFVVDDAEVGKPGDCKVESWVSSADNRDLIAVTAPTCAINLGVPVELGGQVARSRSDDVWSTTLGVKAKVNLRPVDQGGFGIGLSGGAGWQTSDGQSTGGFINVPVTVPAGKDFRFNFNIGWQYDALTVSHYASWGAGFEWNLMPRVAMIGEIYGLAGPRTGPATTDPRAQVGLRFTPVDRIDFDLIYGRNLTGEDAHWITIGVNVRFQ